MRQLKFRAWDGTGMLLSPSEVQYLGTWFDALAPGSLYKGGVVFMQFTGFRDTNEKDIYEGDILSSPSPSITGYEVFYDRGCFRLRYKLKSGDYYDWGPLVRMEEIRRERHSRFTPEVIGNIYENPELLTPNTSLNKQ